MFSKESAGSFKYWFAHWCAFNMTALNADIWKPKYLLHDIEKPWLMLFWKDYEKVHQWHIFHNKHHLEYKCQLGFIRYDELNTKELLIDWECSRLTKEDSQYSALEYLNIKLKEEESWINYCQSKKSPMLSTHINNKISLIFLINECNDIDFNTKFTKAQRSSFKYWFAHWCAFNMTALNLGVWKFKYLFHDILKPWMKLIFPYKKVQYLHRTQSTHHPEHLFLNPDKYFDFESMIIDWECSHYTKESCPRLAYEEYLAKNEEYKENYGEYNPSIIRFELGSERVLKQFNLIKK